MLEKLRIIISKRFKTVLKTVNFASYHSCLISVDLRSYMRAHVLLTLLNELGLGEQEKIQGFAMKKLIHFPQ